MVDIHNRSRRLDAAVKFLLNNKSILQENKQKILDFKEYCVAESLSVARQLFYLQRLTRVAEKVGEKRFENCTKADIESLMRYVNTAKTRSGKGWSQWNRVAYAVTIKKFWRWLKDTEAGADPEETRWIKIRWPEDSQILPEDLLTIEETLTMLRVAKKRGIMWWAMVAVADDKALRPEEWIGLTIGQIAFDQYGAAAVVKSGKVGERRVRLVSSAPALREWLAVHPDSDNPNASVWLYGSGTRKGQTLSYDSIRLALQSIARKAGTRKRVTAYTFRHTSITRASTKLTEPVMRKVYGWTPSSRIPARYIHLSGRDVDDQVLAMHGIVRESREEKILNPRRCVRCDLMNSPEASFCSRCSAPLDEDAINALDEKRRRADEVMTELLRDKEVQALIARKIEQLHLEPKLVGEQVREESEPTRAVGHQHHQPNHDTRRSINPP